MAKDVSDDELDDILNGALEAFGDTDVGATSKEAANTKPPAHEPPKTESEPARNDPPPEVSEEATKAFEDALKALEDLGLDQGEEGEDLNETDMKLVEEFMNSLGNSFAGLGVPGSSAAPTHSGRGGVTGHERQATTGTQNGPATGGVPDVEKLVESIVGHLLSEDVLKAPMLQMRAAYAEWLPKHAEDLSAEELGRYSKQQQLVDEICEQYEKGAESSAIMDLLSKMQETGAPPAEVMKGLSDNSDNSDGGSLPGVPPRELDKMVESCGMQ